MATELEAARQLLYDTALAWESGEYPVKQISMAKLYGGIVVNRVMNECLQIFGGMGYSTEPGSTGPGATPGCCGSAAGTDEVMREVISKTMAPGWCRSRHARSSRSVT